MKIIINSSSMVPIYEQIMDQIKARITAGDLKENDILPSVRTLAKDLKISALTVKKAYDNLEQEGYTVTVHGKGTYVAAANTERMLEEQRREVESQMVPEAARTYASLLGEIRKMEQEIASPRYANQLAAFRSQKNQVKKQLEDRQKEKEALLEKAAKGRQILLNSQFTDPDSVTA